MKTYAGGELSAMFVLGVISGAILHMVIYSEINRFGIESLKAKGLIEYDAKTGSLKWIDNPKGKY